MNRLAGLALALVFLASCSAPPAPQPEPAPSVPAAAQPEENVLGSLRVTASALNVRSAPESAAAVVTAVKKGTRLALLERAGDWSRVRLANGQVGWVSSKHVRAERGCPPDRTFKMVSTPPLSFSDSGAHGKVTVEATVDKSGSVVATKVVQNTTGSEALGAAAEKEIRLARFEPPIRRCAPVKFIYVYRRDY